MLMRRDFPLFVPLLTRPALSLQYNRRFVNVVVGLGKKKGPNSNTV